MIGYKKVNVKLSDSQLNKLESAFKHEARYFQEWVWKCSMEIIYLKELLLTTRQKPKLKMHLKIICQLI